MTKIFYYIASETAVPMMIVSIVQHKMSFLTARIGTLRRKEICQITCRHSKHKQPSKNHHCLVGHLGHHQKSLVARRGYQIGKQRAKTYHIVSVERHRRITAYAARSYTKQRRYEYLQTRIPLHKSVHVPLGEHVEVFKHHYHRQYKERDDHNLSHHVRQKFMEHLSTYCA